MPNERQSPYMEMIDACRDIPTPDDRCPECKREGSQFHFGLCEDCHHEMKMTHDKVYYEKYKRKEKVTK